MYKSNKSKIGPFLERGINFRGILFRTGYQFGVPGGTYPPKNTQVPPRVVAYVGDIVEHFSPLLVALLFRNGKRKTAIVKIAKFKSREIFLFQIRKIKVARK